MRWTRLGRQTSGQAADGEIVWSWRPVLAPSLRRDELAGDGGKNAGDVISVTGHDKGIPKYGQINLRSFKEAIKHLHS